MVRQNLYDVEHGIVFVQHLGSEAKGRLGLRTIISCDNDYLRIQQGERERSGRGQHGLQNDCAVRKVGNSRVKKSLSASLLKPL